MFLFIVSDYSASFIFPFTTFRAGVPRAQLPTGIAPDVLFLVDERF